jgi:hypothetical protein
MKMVGEKFGNEQHLKRHSQCYELKCAHAHSEKSAEAKFL